MTVTAPDNDGYCDVSSDAINDAVEQLNITLVGRLRFTDNTVSQQTLESIKVTARSMYAAMFFYSRHTVVHWRIQGGHDPDLQSVNGTWPPASKEFCMS